MKKLVGFNVLEAILAPICEPQEPDYSKLSQINGCDEHQMRSVIRNFIKPYYDSFDEQSRKVIADSILYFSLQKNPPLRVTLEGLPAPFDLTSDISQLCDWLMEELMIKKENFDVEKFLYSDDLSLVQRLQRDRQLTI